jgi:Xaa-Pro aminopeptidase
VIRLHADWTYLEQQFGCSIRDRFLMAVRSLDNPRAVSPFLLERDGRRFGLFLHVEKGNVQAAQIPADIVPLYYRPYFTFEASERPPHVHTTLADAIASVSGSDDTVIMDPRAPLAVADELRPRFKVQLDDAPEIGSVTLRLTSCADVMNILSRGRPSAAATARRLLDRSPVRDQLYPFLERHEDHRFGTLDAALRADGIDVLIVSSPLNMQEIGGVPVGCKQRPLAVLYRPGEGVAWVMEAGRSAHGQEFESPRTALQQVLRSAGARIGVEIEDVDLGLARAAGLDDRKWVPADHTIRKWRDENTLPDLPYYIIATRITRHAIHSALDFASTGLRRNAPMTEMDPYGVYLRSMWEFAAQTMPGSRVARTLTNFHSSARSMFPANAAPYPVDGDMNALKIDAGCLLFDDTGVLLGCSDIARTLSMSDDANDIYKLFQSGVRQTLVPGCSAGRTGEALHADAVGAIWGHPREMAGNPLFVDLADPMREYDRDTGHLLGKNNLAHLRFVRGDKQALQEGMIACCEYQWPVNGYAIAYEDTCLVTSIGGLNLTSDDE